MIHADSIYKLDTQIEEKIHDSATISTHFPTLSSLLPTPSAPIRKGTRNYRLNLPSVVTGQRATEMLDALRQKNSEIATLQLEKKEIEGKIKETRLKIAEEKKKRPRKKRGEVVQQTEAESELKDFIHRKNLMAERLSFLSKKQSAGESDADQAEDFVGNENEELEEEMLADNYENEQMRIENDDMTLEQTLTVESPPEILSSRRNKRKSVRRNNSHAKKK
jgi:hypothetical protein